MEVTIAKSFLKDLKSKPKPLIQDVEKLIAKLEAAPNLEKSGVDYKKMEGQQKDEHYYRIRLATWPVGIEYIYPRTIIIRILSRGEIDRYFPPQ